jgi:hypothetical protein
MLRTKEVWVVELNDQLEQILTSNDERISKTDLYEKLTNEHAKLSDKIASYLFQNIKLGEERGKSESEIKLLQAKIIALKAAETYLDTLTEETNNRMSNLSSTIRQLEDDQEVKKHIKSKQKK